MRDEDIKHLLFQLGVPTTNISYSGGRNGRWLNVSCPFAPFTHGKGTDKNPSFGITVSEDEGSYYKCLSCGIKGRLSMLPSKLGGYRKKDYGKLERWATLAELSAKSAKPLPEWDAPQSIATEEDENDDQLPDPSLINTYPRALGMRYLRERGIVFPTPLKLDLRYDSYQRRVLFPCYNRYGQFAGFTGRSILPDARLHKRNPKVRDYYGLDKRELLLGLPRLDSGGRRIIVEGLFDYARGVQSGFRSTRAILGTALTQEKIDILLSEGEPVYLFMDNDRAGWNAAFGLFDDDMELKTDQAWAYQLYREIPVWIVPYPTGFNNMDPGSMNKATWEKHISKAWLFTGRAPMNDMLEPTFQVP